MTGSNESIERYNEQNGDSELQSPGSKFSQESSPAIKALKNVVNDKLADLKVLNSLEAL